jgi:hypothetical protein
MRTIRIGNMEFEIEDEEETHSKVIEMVEVEKDKWVRKEEKRKKL